MHNSVLLVALCLSLGACGSVLPKAPSWRKGREEPSFWSRMLEGAWDSHHHVLDPIRYPVEPDAPYVPGVYTVWDNAIFEHKIGCDHVVMIQPSIYGNNNSFLLDSLKAYGSDRAKAVVVFDIEKTTTSELQYWDFLGVRGVRVNLLSTGETPEPGELISTIRQYADAVRPLGWAVQLYIAMKDIPSIESAVSNLGVQVVFDHFGHPEVPEPSSNLTQSTYDPYNINGFGSLIRLLQSGNSWVKVSAPYRLSHEEGPFYRDIDPIITELFREAPSRIMYASDWPHTRFEGLDIQPWTEHLLGLTGDDDGLRQNLFRDNANSLWNGKE